MGHCLLSLRRRMLRSLGVWSSRFSRQCWTPPAPWPGASPQQLWQQVQEVSSKVSALWHAVHAAVMLRSAAAASDEAVADGSATLLQLSHCQSITPLPPLPPPPPLEAPLPYVPAAAAALCCDRVLYSSRRLAPLTWMID